MDVENQQVLPFVERSTHELPSTAAYHLPTAPISDYRSDDLPYTHLFAICLIVTAHMIYAATPSGAVATCKQKFWVYLVAFIPWTFLTFVGMSALRKHVLKVRGWRPGMLQTKLCYAVVIAVSALLHIASLWEAYSFCRDVESQQET